MNKREKLALLCGCALLLVSLLQLPGAGTLTASDIHAPAQSGLTSGFGRALLQHACLVAGAICIAPFLCNLVAAPLHAMVDYLYFGSQDSDPPPLNLRLARGYEAAHRWDDAQAEYERFMAFYPQETELWTGAIRCARALGRNDEAQRLIDTAPATWRQLPPS